MLPWEPLTKAPAKMRSKMAKMAQNPGFRPKIGFLAILDLIFAGVLGRGSHESVLKSSNFTLKDGLYAIVVVLGGLILVGILDPKPLIYPPRYPL